MGGLVAAAAAAGCSQATRITRTRTPSAESRGGTASSSSSPPPSPASSSAPPRSSTAARATPRTPAVEYAHGSRSRNQVALTFHGAGDPAIARDLLAIFAAHRAKVTVLAV
ncbi:MAG TPA: hypothetical protein VGN48_04620, partial [Pedococcus sp.]|nr:hypothetical protein [Pedococcus sp.]